MAKEIDSKMDQVDTRTGAVTDTSTLTDRDFQDMADMICDELQYRRGERADFERIWDEVDRQLRLEYNDSSRYDNGQPIEQMMWKSTVEPPFQAQTLEILVGDARRLMFPDNEPWFVGHMVMEDDFLEKNSSLIQGVEERGLVDVIAGDKNKIPSRVTQDYLDRSAEGFLNHFHRQYDFFGNWDRVNSEALCYGTGVGTLRPVKKRVKRTTARGVETMSRAMPMWLPKSIRNTYLDISCQNVQSSGIDLAPTTIECKTQKAVDVHLAASTGSTDSNKINGGWIPDNLKELQKDQHDNYEIVEMEGDIVVPRGTDDNLVAYNSIATVAVGGSGRKVIRFRFVKYGDQSFPQTIAVPYENTGENVYSSSPLMKGSSIQRAITVLLNEGLDSTIYNGAPTMAYSPDDSDFAGTGGPKLIPHTTVKTAVGVTPIAIGDVDFQAYLELVRQYYDVVGVNPPRLGAETKSHTTLGAKQIETSMGASRTVGFVKRTSMSPMMTLLDREYRMGKALGGEHIFFVDKYNGFIEVKMSQLADEGIFEVFGSSGPQEELARERRRQESLQRALQIDIMKMQAGQKPELDWGEIQRSVLADGGWSDFDSFFIAETEGNAGNAAAEPAVNGNAGGLPPGAAFAPIQAVQS